MRDDDDDDDNDDDDDDDNEDGDSAMPIIMANERGDMAPVPASPYSRILGRILTTFVTPLSLECRVIHADIHAVSECRYDAAI